MAVPLAQRAVQLGIVPCYIINHELVVRFPLLLRNTFKRSFRAYPRRGT